MIPYDELGEYAHDSENQDCETGYPRIHITQQTVLELQAAINKAQAQRAEGNTAALRGQEGDEILVQSDFADMSFQIRLEMRPQSQESLGYRLVPGGPASTTNDDNREGSNTDEG